jgi:hypothetical protein
MVVTGKLRLTTLVAPTDGVDDPDRRSQELSLSLTFPLPLYTLLWRPPLDYKREGPP